MNKITRIKRVFNYEVAQQLIYRGILFIRCERNKFKTDQTVFIFLETDEFLSAFNDILTSRGCVKVNV